MRGQLLAIVLLVLVPVAFTQGQERPEAYPGQANHEHPPDDFFCRDRPEPGEHACLCKRMTGADDPLCENEPDVRECEVWCYAKGHFIPEATHPVDRVTGQRGYWHSSHCRCPIICHDGK